MKHHIRRLTPGDEGLLERFLRRHVDSSMFLLGNLHARGLAYTGEAYEAEYVAAFDENGAVTGVVAHAWNGMLLVQAPEGAADLAKAAMAASGRTVIGLTGPWIPVNDARAALGMTARPTTMDSREDLFALELAALRVPEALASGRWRVRRPHSSERDLLVAWRAAYRSETLGETASPSLTEKSADDIARLDQAGRHFVLMDDGEIVAYTAFNARLPDIVQIGGVWTPVPWRRRGYGRAVLAGALSAARAEGTVRAVLFTDAGNHGAQGAYRALGFAPIGDYGLVLFA